MVWCDAGYQGVHKREENRELKVDWQVAMRPGKRRKLEPGSEEAVAEKESVRAKVEHPFLKVKRIFGYGKVRYRGLAKNTQRLALLLGLLLHTLELNYGKCRRHGRTAPTSQRLSELWTSLSLKRARTLYSAIRGAATASVTVRTPGVIRLL